MKEAVIDIGSNSVRLMLAENGKTPCKFLETTRLSKNMKDGILDNEQMKLTAQAVQGFADRALSEGAERLYCFATEAVRSAVNAQDFLKMLAISADVLDGEREARLAYLGACGNAAGLNVVIDIGGASTEIVCGQDGEIQSAVSLPIGTVRLYDACGEDAEKIDGYLKIYLEKIADFSACQNAFVIGGTCLNLAAAVNNIVPYDPFLVHASIIERSALRRTARRLQSMDRDARILAGIQPARADVIACGARLMLRVLEKAGLTRVTASENDNLEGYLLERQRRDKPK